MFFTATHRLHPRTQQVIGDLLQQIDSHIRSFDSLLPAHAREAKVYSLTLLKKAFKRVESHEVSIADVITRWATSLRFINLPGSASVPVISQHQNLFYQPHDPVNTMKFIKDIMEEYGHVPLRDSDNSSASDCPVPRNMTF